MDIQYFGGNCIRISTKKTSVVVDDNLKDLGQKSIVKSDDIVLSTHNGIEGGSGLTISQPGEYEVSAIAIQGIAARGHMDEDGVKNSTIYKLTVNSLRTCVLGHVYPDLSEDQLEAIGIVDVLIIPVGGNGYTLDAAGALKVIKKIEPKIIIPTHFADNKLKYPVPQAEITDALQAMSMEAKETVPKLKVKAADLPELTEVVILERQ